MNAWTPEAAIVQVTAAQQAPRPLCATASCIGQP